MNIKILIISITLFLLFSCEKKKKWGALISDKNWQVEDWHIRERIYNEGGFPDHIFNRRYTVTRKGVELPTISYWDEEKKSLKGIKTAPFCIDSHLIILSTHSSYIISPTDQISEFVVWRAENWSHFVDSLPDVDYISPYAYHADTVRRVEKGWEITYKRVSRGSLPEFLTFTTDDEWQRFTLINRPVEE